RVLETLVPAAEPGTVHAPTAISSNGAATSTASEDTELTLMPLPGTGATPEDPSAAREAPVHETPVPAKVATGQNGSRAPSEKLSSETPRSESPGSENVEELTPKDSTEEENVSPALRRQIEGLAKRMGAAFKPPKSRQEALAELRRLSAIPGS